MLFWKTLLAHDCQIAREEGEEGRNDYEERESKGVTIWLGPRWIAPRGLGPRWIAPQGLGQLAPRGLGQHQQNFVPRDAAMLLVGKRR